MIILILIHMDRTILLVFLGSLHSIFWNHEIQIIKKRFSFQIHFQSSMSYDLSVWYLHPWGPLSVLERQPRALLVIYIVLGVTRTNYPD